jgi:simple sugar transport system substrate-binding protein
VRPRERGWHLGTSGGTVAAMPVRSRGLALLVPLLAAAALAGCGRTTVVREAPVVVRGDETAPTGIGQPEGTDRTLRIAVVTHGQASSPFWAIVRTGVEAAARQMDVLVTYKAPEVYSLPRMRELLAQAVASRPDGLVVSIPEAGIEPDIRKAVRAGIPTVSINSGAGVYKRLGVLAHVGQREEKAGFEAGRRLARAGVRHALCVNQQAGNQGLDARCRGLARAMRRVDGGSAVLQVDDQDPATVRQIADTLARRQFDGVLALNSTSGLESATAARMAGIVGAIKVATFDLGPDVLKEVRAGRILFAVDQQAYLQGYLPVVMLAQRSRYGLFPAQGQVIDTGPHFVERKDAGKALALSRRSIR